MTNLTASRLPRLGRRQLTALLQRFYATAKTPSFPTTQTCPSPTCECAATPALPDGLEIDRKAPLNGVMSNYNQQVVICTGKDDWPSRIEEEHSGDNLAADLKELFGRGGVYSDPFHNVSVINSSFPPSIPRRAELVNHSAYLLPSFKYVPFLPRVSFDSVRALAKGYLLPERLHPAHDGLPPVHRDALTREPVFRRFLRGVRDVEDVLVLVCGHGGRDMRCGVMGPVLRDEFEAQLPRLGVRVLRGPVQAGGSESGDGRDEAAGAISGAVQGPDPAVMTAQVGLISHIGGHKFAGNVIIYLPPSATLASRPGGLRHPLSGYGIWYGRVEPRHVQGVIEETVIKGNVIEDMFRGGIKQDGDILRL